MPQLTKQDLDLLVEAVEKWEQSFTTDKLLQIMMKAQACQNQQDARELQREAEAEGVKDRPEIKSRRERSVMLRAKLITLRDAAVASDFVDEAQR